MTSPAPDTDPISRLGGPGRSEKGRRWGWEAGGGGFERGFEVGQPAEGRGWGGGWWVFFSARCAFHINTRILSPSTAGGGVGLRGEK